MGLLLNKIVDEWLEVENTPKLLLKSTNRKILIYIFLVIYLIYLSLISVILKTLLMIWMKVKNEQHFMFFRA